MAPPSSPKSLGQTVLIHWNASTEMSRAISMAMPILCKAQRVMLLTVEGNVVPGPAAKDGLRHLADHGIAATEKTLGARGQRPGEVILAEARAQGADLLIKGAYTQSRFRQMIFGGATQHILAAAELPVFLAEEDAGGGGTLERKREGGRRNGSPTQIHSTPSLDLFWSTSKFYLLWAQALRRQMSLQRRAWERRLSRRVSQEKTRKYPQTNL
jgi:nucleotide-binding universal stress UspA family protein